MARRLYKISGYRIITPKYRKMKVLSKENFEFDILEYWLYSVMKLKQKAKTYSFPIKNSNGKKIMYLDSIITNNKKYLFGKFKTGSYGTTQEFYNRFNNNRTYEKTMNETSDDDVFFYLYKSTGVFLIGRDPNHAINISSIKKYFSKYEFLIEPFRLKFNLVNDKGPQIYKNRMITVQSLPPIDFFEEINNMSKIKEASFVIDKDSASDTFGILKELKSLDNNRGVKEKDVEIEISLKNVSGKKLVREFEKLFTLMNADEKFDDLRIVGQHNTGNMRTIRNNMPIRTFEFNVDYGSKIYPINDSEVERGFQKLINEWKILFGAVHPTKDINFPEKVDEIKNEINKEIKIHNRKFYSIKRYRRKLFRKI